MSTTPEVFDPAIADEPLNGRTPEKFELGALKFWALGDRVIIQEDEFRTGYECSSCDGKGKVPCANCHGAGSHSLGGPVKKCSHCEGAGHLRCSSCSGKGALIVAPEIAQRRPTSGTVVSAGQRCKYLREGDSVLYSNFAGYVVDLDRAGAKVTLRILHESEILAGMDGHLTLSNLKGKSEIAQFNN